MCTFALEVSRYGILSWTCVAYPLPQLCWDLNDLQYIIFCRSEVQGQIEWAFINESLALLCRNHGEIVAMLLQSRLEECLQTASLCGRSWWFPTWGDDPLPHLNLIKVCLYSSESRSELWKLKSSKLKFNLKFLAHMYHTQISVIPPPPCIWLCKGYYDDFNFFYCPQCKVFGDHWQLQTDSHSLCTKHTTCVWHILYWSVYVHTFFLTFLLPVLYIHTVLS